jgi:hypothetical protein
MQSAWRRCAAGVVATISVVLGTGVVNLSAQAPDPHIGTWKLNVAKSQFNAGPPLRSLTVKVEPAGEGEKVTIEGVNADGTRIAIGYTANFDGTDYPLTGSRMASTVALKRIDARTAERTDKKADGTVAVTSRRVVSQDGQTMTATVKGDSTLAWAPDAVLVFEKQ